MSHGSAAPPAVGPKLPLVALAGNPNTGKTTLFNRLTGSDQKVGNYPGITVDRYSGALVLGAGRRVELLDVPGAYSLSARSREEEIAVQTLAGLPPAPLPDAVVLVVDATQLSRNLYLALQVIELELPLVIAVNMIDMLRARGEDLDVEALRAELGVPVVAISALRGEGLDALRLALDQTLAHPRQAVPGARWSPDNAALRADVEAVSAALPPEWLHGSAARARALALWALLSLDEHDELSGASAALRAAASARRAQAEAAGRHIDAEVVQGRYGWIDSRMPRFLRPATRAYRSATERIDSVLLHPAAGFAIFLAAMGLVFQALFTWAGPAMDAVETVFGWLADGASALIPAGIVRDFVTEGLVAGVGSVMVFLPQILLLFLFIGLMEDSGYMARVAFLMDRVMRAMGLHGRAFVPMLSGYACAVPAILATRTMERQRDRVLTMMVVPLMTCSARLPVYTLIVGALFPPAVVLGFLPVQGLLMVAMYLFSTLMALIAAAVLSRTLFRARPAQLILELPPYRLPHWPSVLRMMWQRAGAFLREAGGVILACTIVLWLLLSFPRGGELRAELDTRQAAVAAQNLPAAEQAARSAELQAEYEGAALRQSWGGRLGRALEPAIEPLGFDWKIGIGLIGAFAAREVFVSTLGLVYGVGRDEGEESTTLRARIREEARADGRPVYTPLVGLSLMVFFALACQCMSTLAAVKRETAGWKWPLFLFGYMTVLAWIASFALYQGGMLLGLG